VKCVPFIGVLLLHYVESNSSFQIVHWNNFKSCGPITLGYITFKRRNASSSSRNNGSSAGGSSSSNSSIGGGGGFIGALSTPAFQFGYKDMTERDSQGFITKSNSFSITAHKTDTKNTGGATIKRCGEVISMTILA
jgi:hypothetical protein